MKPPKIKKIIFIQGVHDIPIKNKKLFVFLEAHGYEVIYFPLFYTAISTDKQKKLISDISLYIKNSSQSVSILAHSFGGILAYSLSEDVYNKIDSIVTVGSPHTLKHKWFIEVCKVIGYKKHTVKNQVSIGMAGDVLVIPKYTRYDKLLPHHILAGFHETLLRNKKFMEKVGGQL